MAPIIGTVRDGGLMYPATSSRIRHRSAGLTVEGPVDRRLRDRKQLGQVADRIVASGVQAARFLPLPVGHLTA